MQKWAFKKVSNSKSKKSPGGEEEGNEVHLGLPCERQKLVFDRPYAWLYGGLVGVCNNCF